MVESVPDTVCIRSVCLNLRTRIFVTRTGPFQELDSGECKHNYSEFVRLFAGRYLKYAMECRRCGVNGQVVCECVGKFSVVPRWTWDISSWHGVTFAHALHFFPALVTIFQCVIINDDIIDYRLTANSAVSTVLQFAV